ncbi:FecR domain-containing protein, partial [Candidatus Pacearchaeota archaeon]|nr:FecR domain-containing protein [Candidatus Pacearchaeota archaeon]
MPFLVIAALFFAIFYGWQSLNDMFISENKSTTSQKVFLNIESGSAKAMTVGKGEWQNAPDKIYLYRDEHVKTGSDGRATLTFFDQSISRMNTDTEMAFTSLKKKGDTYNIEAQLDKGDTWIKVEQVINPDSTFSLTTDLVTVDTRGAVLSLSAPGTVYVMEGNVQIGVKYDDEVIKTFNLGVGQQFIADEEKVGAIKRGEDAEVIFALSDTFKHTNWYRWNIKKDGAVNAFEESDLDDEDLAEDDTEEDEEAMPDDDENEEVDLANVGRVVYVTKPSKNTETSDSTITVQGNFDEEKINAVFVDDTKATITGAGKWKVSSVKLGPEGKNELKIEAEDLDGERITLDSLVVIYDKTAPQAPRIIDPILEEGAESFVVEDVEQLIEGAVGKDTAAVIVNDYRLTKYVPGSKEFTYYAKTEYGNLNEGENEYTVYAEDKAGNRSDATIIILTLDQEVIDAAGEGGDEEEASASDATPAESLPSASSSGGVKITAPNDGESLITSETEFEIAGTVPPNTAVVKVNDYKLSLFELGDATFKYRAYVSMG